MKLQHPERRNSLPESIKTESMNGHADGPMQRLRLPSALPKLERDVVRATMSTVRKGDCTRQAVLRLHQRLHARTACKPTQLLVTRGSVHL